MRSLRIISRLYRPFLKSTNRRTHSHSDQLVYSQEVKQALQNGCPVVALESTIITHGMPFPTNLSMAEEVEGIIRQGGATPATIAVIKGNIHIGLTRDQLIELAEMTVPAVKTSRRDVAWVMANKLNGGTTVSGTMLIAHLAGLGIFVTGGVGGVHRGGQDSMDISADLTELGRTPVTVISAGVKSILDIGLTLEYLETQGVCVATLGSDIFPAFYTRNSNYRSPYRLEDSIAAARLVEARNKIGLSSGILIGVPIPESESARGELIEDAIQVSLKEAEEKRIQGRQLTPFILSRLNELTEGESLRANLALVKNNALVGTEIAVEVAELRERSSNYNARQDGDTTLALSDTQISPSSPLVIGGTNFDFVVRISEGKVNLDGGTYKGSLSYSQGGVGRNVASALTRLGSRARLVTAIGRDERGNELLSSKDLDTSLVKVVEGERSATYTAVLDSMGECKFGVGDMDIHSSLTPSYILELEKEIAKVPLVVGDGNLSHDTLGTLLDICHRSTVPFFYEPTDLRKATQTLNCPNVSAMTYCSPNLSELMAMLSCVPGPPEILARVTLENAEKSVHQVARAATKIVNEFKLNVVLITLSECGVVVVRRGQPDDQLPLKGTPYLDTRDDVSAVWYPGEPCPVDNVISVSGAGDCLTAGFIAGIIKGLPQDICISAGLQAAKISCTVAAAVPNIMEINWETPAIGHRII